MQANPVGEFAWLRRFMARVAEVEAAVRDLQQARQTYLQGATVTAYTAPPYCTVEFASGETAVVQLLSGYTPVVGHQVAVLCCPFLSVVVGRLA
jgi:hypothetical protein